MMEAFHWFSEFVGEPDDIVMDAEKKFVCEMAKTKKNLLDVGALYGAFSLSFLSQNPTINHAYAFDPSPQAYHVLKQHQLLNHNLHFFTYNLALGKRPWKFKMRYNRLHLEVLPDDAKKFNYVAPVTTLDSFVKDSGILFDFIKIDCEWSELFVLEWGREFLRNHDPVILLELHYHMLKNLWIEPLDVFSYLSQLWFSFYDFSKSLLWDIESYLSAKNAVYFVVCSKNPL